MPNTPYGIQALTGELNKLARAGEGDRNNTLNEVWLKLSKRVLAGHLDKIETAQRVYETARSIGLDDSEIRATMASAEKRAADDGPGSIPEPRPPIDFGGLKTTGGGVQQTPPDTSTSTDGEPAPNYDHLFLPRSGLASLPKPQPLIEGVLDEHTLFAVTGRDRSYKSFLVLDWLACLATGQSWLDHAARQTKVLLVVGEGAYGLDARLTSWEAANRPVNDAWFHVRRAPVNLLRRAADVADLFDRIEREQYGVIIFDTLQRMISGAESNYDRDAGRIIESMDLLRRANDRLAVGVVAHTGKDDNDIRGSSAFEDDIDMVWRVKRDPEQNDVINVKLDKRKDGPEGLHYEMEPYRVPDTESIILRRASKLLNPDAMPAHALKIMQLLARASTPDDGLGPTRISEAIGAHYNSVSKALDWLMDRRYVIKLGGKSRPTFKLTELGTHTVDELTGDAS